MARDVPVEQGPERAAVAGVGGARGDEVLLGGEAGPAQRVPGGAGELGEERAQRAAVALAEGVQRVQLDTGIPVMFGVLTTEDLDQALARSEDVGGHNVGEECGRGAVEMVGLLRAVKTRMG